MKIELTRDQVHDVVRDELKYLIEMFEKGGSDPFETRDNYNRDAAALYTVVKMYMTCDEYDEFVKDRKVGNR